MEQESERQRRSYELFRTSKDYYDEIMFLRELTVINHPKIKSAIGHLVEGLDQLEKCRVEESAQFRKKQSWWSKWKDRRLEKKMQKEESRQQAEEQAEQEADKARQDEIQKAQQELQQKLQEYEQRMNSVQQFLESKGVDLSLLLAPPNDSEAKEPEVVEDNEGSGENEETTPDADGEADCLKF